MDTKTAHIPETPPYAFVIRIVQFVFAVIILGLAGYSIDGCGSYYFYSNCGFGSAPGFVIFCSVWTFVIVGYLIVTTLWFPIAYNMWAQLFFEITGCIFWLSGFAALAAQVQSLSDSSSAPKWKTAAAASGLGALMWLLFIATMVTFIIQLRKHLNDPANKGLSRLGLSAAEKGVNTEMGAVGVQQPPNQYPVQPTPVPYSAQPTPAIYSAQPTPAPVEQYPEPVQSPVSYVQPTPPPQQWQQSPQPGHYPQ